MILFSATNVFQLVPLVLLLLTFGAARLTARRLGVNILDIILFRKVNNPTIANTVKKEQRAFLAWVIICILIFLLIGATAEKVF